MKLFHCDHCEQLVFFENTSCLACGHPLAYLPDQGRIAALEADGANQWRQPGAANEAPRYRLCENYSRENVCNWAVPTTDPNVLCQSCRLTRVIPDLNQPGHKEAWYRMEVAKRRLVYSLLDLGLPLKNKNEDPSRGLAYEFLAPAPEGDVGGRVITGHDNGVITIDLAEADDAQREQRRTQLQEPYRTLLGHFRHEIGHYYWDVLVQGGTRLEAFRELFGDERADYQVSLQRYYESGVPADWQQAFISAYASAHPWEDWAETWAHYLHMTDVLETAAACGLSLRPRRRDEPSLAAVPDTRRSSFERMVESWFPLTYVLNNLNRGLGLADGYPFVLSPRVIEKLRFIDDTIRASRP